MVGRRTWLKVARRPVTLIFSFVQPLIWLLFFGFLFNRYEVGSTLGDVRYLDFLVPGVCAMTVLFGASQAGVELIRDLDTGFLERMLTTPAAASTILFGKLSADVLRLLLQALVILVLGKALGAEVSLDPLRLVAAGSALLLFAVLFASLSCLVALLARIQERMATFVHLVNMPLLFTSSALVPVRDMPEWLARVARVNPLSLTVDSCRTALLFGDHRELATNLSALGLMAGTSFLLAAVGMRFLGVRQE